MTRAASRANQVGRLLPVGLRPAVRRQLVRFRHRGITPADAVLVSYPKSGSTWLRFLLGAALADLQVDFDSVREALPPVGRHRGAPRLLRGAGRLLRSHEPLDALAGRPEVPVVYLVRDGRPVAVSYLHHQRRTGAFSGDLAAFLPRFLSGAVDSYGPWHGHALEAARARDSGARQLLVVRYEDLRRDTVAELGRVVAFLGVTPGAERLEAAVAANSKEQMRAKEHTSKALRRGNADGSAFVRPDGPSWEQEFDPSMRQMFDEVAGAALRAFGY